MECRKPLLNWTTSEIKCFCLGSVRAPSFNEMTGRVYSAMGLSPTVRTFCGGGQETKIAVHEDGYPRRKDMETNKRLRIRKLTEGECYRFMGFQKKDYEACVKAGQSKSSVYHQAGDSIVTTCLVGIFGELLGIEYDKIIQDYADGLHEEVSE